MHNLYVLLPAAKYNTILIITLFLWFSYLPKATYSSFITASRKIAYIILTNHA
jgi:hypothetical protein